MDQIAVIDDARDVEYVRTHFLTLEELCALCGRDAVTVAVEMDAGAIPAPAYVLRARARYVPRDYFDCTLSKDAFIDRFTREAARLGVPSSPEAALDEWTAYMSGVYFVCLVQATPENIARKTAFLLRIDVLTGSPEPENAAWLNELREAVDALDALERPFSPVYDRTRFGRPPTRDTHINNVRRRFGL